MRLDRGGGGGGAVGLAGARGPGAVAGARLLAGESLLTAVAWGLDKRRARRAGGGWPGALWAQRAFRHKTRDRAFRRVFWALVGLHLVAWAAWASRPWLP